MSDTYSKDILAKIFVDKVGEEFFVKRKISFGPDGSYQDVTNTSPFPVTSGVFNAPNNSDALAVTYPSSVQEVYQFYNGGLSGTLVMTLTVIYTDSTKFEIQSVVRT